MKNVFVMGLNDFNRALLERVRGAEDYAFHTLVANEKVEEPERYRIRELLSEAEAQLAAFPGRVDAVVGYIDIPVGALLPILCAKRGLPTPTLEAVLRCQNKYWARLEQERVVPEHVPRYCLVDPFAARPEAALTRDYPFWLKPVKSAGSFLGFRIGGPRQFRDKLAVIRAEIGRLAEPFDFLMDHAGLRDGPVALNFSHCVAEQLVGGGSAPWRGSSFGARSGYTGWWIPSAAATAAPSRGTNTLRRCPVRSRGAWWPWPSGSCRPWVWTKPPSTWSFSGIRPGTASGCWRPTPACPSRTATGSSWWTACPITR